MKKMNILCILISSLLYIGCTTHRIQTVNNDLTSEVKVTTRNNIVHIEKTPITVTKEILVKQEENDKLKKDTLWINILIGIVPFILIIGLCLL